MTDSGQIKMRGKQVRIHDSISHVRWAGPLMEVGSLFGLNFVGKKTGERPRDGMTDGPTDGRKDPYIYIEKECTRLKMFKDYKNKAVTRPTVAKGREFC